ncbi:Hypothetical predicted protein [Octopus vulgaris]|uniref:Uncharacterized protein n=1 Tax=Octopus vulgaris TaxID=6645 RepID=A0AA36BDB2_OCTVU|nr:Hypothetical predicted protein [Octopus vulgaris]
MLRDALPSANLSHVVDSHYYQLMLQLFFFKPYNNFNTVCRIIFSAISSAIMVVAVVVVFRIVVVVVVAVVSFVLAVVCGIGDGNGGGGGVGGGGVTAVSWIL